MQLSPKTKRRIAIEFLFLIIPAILAVLVLICSLIYATVQQDKVRVSIEILQTKLDSLENIQAEQFKFPLPKEARKVESNQEDNGFIPDAAPSKADSIHTEIRLLRTELFSWDSFAKNIVGNGDESFFEIDYVIIVMVLYFFLFPIRYLFYGIRWAIRTVLTKPQV